MGERAQVSPFAGRGEAFIDQRTGSGSLVYPSVYKDPKKRRRTGQSAAKVRAERRNSVEGSRRVGRNPSGELEGLRLRAKVGEAGLGKERRSRRLTAHPCALREHYPFGQSPTAS